MDLEEFRAAHPPKPPQSDPPRGVVMGPNPRIERPVSNFTTNLDAGLCPICRAMVKEVAPAAKLDFRIVFYVCVENKFHRFQRPELERQEPSQVQKDAWARM
jgi:hypothetical protein